MACALVDFHLKEFGLRIECREAAAPCCAPSPAALASKRSARIRHFVQLWLARFFVAQRYGRGTGSHIFGCEIGGFAFDDTA